MLNFEPVTLDKKELMERYFLAYGEGSCQHSFVSSFCLAGKYGDRVCEREGVLYILRSLRCTDGERVYLFPQGGGPDLDAVRRAIAMVLDDAHEHGATVRFETLTARAKDLALSLFPGVFTATENRDYAEYVYSVDKLVNLPGHEMARKRQAIHAFERDFGARSQVLPIEAEYIPAIRAFQRSWLEAKAGEADKGLEREDAAIQRALDHFSDLGLSGIIVLIDGELRAYAYGAPLSEGVFDVMVGKGDTSIPNIYCAFIRGFARSCCQGYSWINLEEDVGDPGLRMAKMYYKPDLLMEKFVVREGERPS